MEVSIRKPQGNTPARIEYTLTDEEKKRLTALNVDLEGYFAGKSLDTAENVNAYVKVAKKEIRDLVKAAVDNAEADKKIEIDLANLLG